MSEMLEFDEEASRAVEEVYGTDDVVEQRRIVIEALAPASGQRALDIGCGPGLLAAEIARAVGAGGRVCGIDASPSMLAIAARRDAGPGAAPVELSEGDVGGRLPFGDGSFDLAVATQVYEYVADMPAALGEARRVLAPGGRLLVLDTDWDSLVWRSRDDGLMARVMTAWDEHLAHRDLPRRLPELLRRGRLRARIDLGRADAERRLRARDLQRRPAGADRALRDGPRRDHRGGRARVGGGPARDGARLLLLREPLHVPRDRVGGERDVVARRSRPRGRQLASTRAHRSSTASASETPCSRTSDFHVENATA